MIVLNDCKNKDNSNTIKI